MLFHSMKSNHVSSAVGYSVVISHPRAVRPPGVARAVPSRLLRCTATQLRVSSLLCTGTSQGEGPESQERDGKEVGVPCGSADRAAFCVRVQESLEQVGCGACGSGARSWGRLGWGCRHCSRAEQWRRTRANLDGVEAAVTVRGARSSVLQARPAP